MKSIVSILTCAFVATMFAALPVRAADQDKAHNCIKCKMAENVKTTEHCPGCHGHMGFDVYGKNSRHGHYVHACTGCDPKTGPCHVAKDGNKVAGM